MALVWFDGFNDGPNGIALRYTTVGTVAMAVNPLTGRAVALEDATTLTRSSSFADTTCVIGFAFRSNVAPSAGTYTLVSVMEGAAAHVTLKYDAATRTLRLYRGTSTLIGTGTIVLPEPDVAYLSWRYIELKVTVGDAGSAEVRVDNTVDISLPATDTKNGGTGQPDAVQLGSAGSSSQTFCYDDMYLLDGTGAKSNYLGRYTTISPATVAADGSFVDWTPSSGTNSSCVDEADENADTDYVESDTRGNLDVYTTYSALGTPTTIHAVSVTSVAKADTALDLRNIVMHSGVEQPGTAHTLTTSYASYSDIFETDPYTSATWTAYDIGQLQIGLEDGVGAFDRYVTSRPYPIAPLEEMDFGVSLSSGLMHGWPLDDADMSVDLYSGSLATLSSTHAQPAESMDVGLDLTSGDITVLLITQSQPAEPMDVALDLTSGTLEVKAYIYTFYPAESADVSVDLTSGTLV